MTNNAQDVKKDFFVNIGKNQGVKQGTVLDVMRKITTYDNINNRVSESFYVTVAKIKVIHAEKTISVARMMRMKNKDNIPVITHYSAMVGDKVEVASE